MVHIALLSSLALFLIADVAAGKDELLADAEENGKWLLSPDGGEARISGRDARYPELVFDFKQLQNGPAKALIETDAKYFYVKAGRKRIKIDMSALKHEVTIDVDGKLLVDGKSDKDRDEDWTKALEREGVETVTLRFARCDFAKVTWKQTFRKRKPRENDTDPANPVDPTNPETFEPAEPEEPAMKDAALRELAQASVIQLRVHRENKHTTSTGLATIIHLDGLAVTNLHVVEGAKSVEAKLEGVDDWIEVTPAAWDAELDLALLQLSRANPIARATMKAVEIADKAPAAEDKLWLIGHTGKQMAIVGTTAESTGRYGDLDRSIQQQMRHSALSRWIIVSGQTPATIAGGAALDAQGRMVGIPAWLWNAKAESSLVLSSSHFQRLIESRPIEAPTWALLNTKLTGVQLPRTTFPRIRVDEDQSSVDLQRSTLMVERAHECDMCKGEGVLTKRVLTGYSRQGNVRTPIYQNEDYACPRCDGKGLEPKDKLHKQLATLSDSIARVNTSDTRIQDTLANTRDFMREMARNHFRSLQVVANAEAKKAIGSGSVHVGEAVILLGTLVRTVKIPGETAPAMGLRLSVDHTVDRSSRTSGKGETKVLLTDPVMVDRGEGKLAIVTGVLTGYVQMRADEAPTAVVSRCLIVPIDEDKIIVRKTAEELTAEREKEREQRRRELERLRRERERRDRD